MSCRSQLFHNLCVIDIMRIPVGTYAASPLLLTITLTIYNYDGTGPSTVLSA
jgi:hypothetical protein